MELLDLRRTVEGSVFNRFADKSIDNNGSASPSAGFSHRRADTEGRTQYRKGACWQAVCGLTRQCIDGSRQDHERATPGLPFVWVQAWKIQAKITRVLVGDRPGANLDTNHGMMCRGVRRPNHALER